VLRTIVALAVTLTASCVVLAPSGAELPAAGATPVAVGERAAAGNKTIGTTTLYLTARGVRVTACRYPADGNGWKSVRFDLDLTRADRSWVPAARFQVNQRFSGRDHRQTWTGWMSNGPTYRYYNGQGRGPAWNASLPIEMALAVQVRTDTRNGTSRWGNLVRWTDLAWCPR